MWRGVAKSLNGASSRILLHGPGTKSRLFEGPKKSVEGGVSDIKTVVTTNTLKDEDIFGLCSMRYSLAKNQYRPRLEIDEQVCETQSLEAE